MAGSWLGDGKDPENKVIASRLLKIVDLQTVYLNLYTGEILTRLLYKIALKSIRKAPNEKRIHDFTPFVATGMTPIPPQ